MRGARIDARLDALEARRLFAAHILGSATIYSTIQAAVNAAIAGATITVDAGTYAEKVSITKSLTIQGAQAGIDARQASRTNGTGPNESIITGATTAGVVSTAFYINANNVTIDGFVVQGETDQTLQTGAGIVIAPNRAGTHIFNNVLHHNVSGLFLANNSTTSSAVIQQNVFRSNNNAGVNGGRGIYTDQSIAGTTLTNVTIDSNAFFNNYGTAQTTGLEAAISMQATAAGRQSNIRITNNSMSGNGKAVLFFNATNLVIEGNTITTTQDQYSGTLRFEGNAQNVKIQYNHVYDNTGPAVAIDSKGTEGSNSGFVVRFNNFHGNNAAYATRIGVIYEAAAYTGTLDTRSNWWGDPSGPSGAGTGTGDAVSAGLFQPGTGLGWKLLAGGDLLYSPWSATVVAPPGVFPTAPIGLTAVASGVTQVTLNWIDTTGGTESGYIIQRSTDGVTFTQVGTTATAVTHFLDITAPAGVDSIYRVLATNTNGVSPASTTATATTPAVGATEKILTTLNWVTATTGYGAIQKNLSMAGNPLKLGSTVYAFGIGTHAISQIVYTLAGGYTHFMADVGVDAEVNAKGVGHVIFTVIGDGRTLFDSGVVTNASAPLSINANVAGVQTLTLLANEGITGNIDYDHADWAAAKLIANGIVLLPPAPSGLTAIATSSSQINLAWTNSATNATGFIIERSADGIVFAPIDTTTAAVTAYSDITVAPQTSYTYRVATTNVVGSSPFSATATATTPPAPVAPTAPSGLTATATSSSKVDLAWTNSATNATGFVIERSTDGIIFAPIGTTAAAVTTYSDTTVAAETSYTYRVAATNTAGASPFSATATATTPPAPVAPTAPSGLTATATSFNKVDLAWTSTATNATSFIIERSTDGIIFAPIGTTAGTITTYSDTTVGAQTSYTYRVAATNAVGPSPYSEIATATTPPAPVLPPTAPSGLTATATSPSQINLAWTNSATNATGFNVERSTDGIAFAPIDTTAGTVTTYSDTTVAAQTSYTYRVAATGTAGVSPFSATATATTPPVPVAPTAPTGLTATATSSSKVDLAWTNSATNATGFIIERSTNGTTFTPLGTTTASATTYSDTTVAAQTSYTYRVAATNAVGQSPFSAVATTTTPPAAVPITTYLSDLNWTSATSGWNTVQKNLSVSGKPLTLKTTVYPKGLGAHAVSNIVYNLGGAFTEFISDVGIDAGAAGSTGSVNFKVLGDNGVVLFASANLTKASPIVTIDVNVTGVQTLTLVATNGIANTIDYDHADWAGARLISSSNVPPAAPSNLAAVAASATQVSLSWKNNAVSSTGFIVQRALGTTGIFTQVGTTAGATTFIDNTVAADTTYAYRVLATNGVTNSAPSNTATATTLPATAISTNLSSLTWTSATTGYGTVQKDKSVAGKIITLRGKTYATGIGTHAVSNIVYNLAGQYKTFISDIGVDDGAKGIGSVIFQVIGDGKLLFDSGVLTSNSAIVSLNIDVTGIKTLTLIAKNGVANNIDYDHADWAGAKLIS